MTEHALQNAIRNDLAGECLMFRANVGSAWAGNKVDRIATPGNVRVLPGDVVVRQARPFSTGLPPGFADCFGLVATLVTPEMVGSYIGVFFAGEIKSSAGRTSEKQAAFLAAVKRNGGRAGVWKSTQDARATVLGEGS